MKKARKIKWWAIRHLGINITRKGIGIRLGRKPLVVLTIWFNALRMPTIFREGVGK